MKKIISIILIFVVSVAFAGIGTQSGTALNLSVNARSGALGQSYSAVGEDASAINYNPAALSQVQSYDLLLMHRIIGDGLNYEYSALSLPLPFGVLGFNFGYIGLPSFEEFSSGSPTGASLSYNDLYFSAGFAREFFNLISLGAGVKYYKNAFGIKNTEDYFSGSTVAFDAGALVAMSLLSQDFSKNLRIGFSIANLGGKINYIGTPHALASEMKIGFFYKPIKYLDVVSDLSLPDDAPFYFGAGLEILPEWYVPIRVGLKKQGSSLIYTAGAGVQYQIGSSKFGVDYAINMEPERGLTHFISVNIQKFSSSLSEFAISKIDMIDIFPGMYKYYSKSGVASVELKNNSNIPIEKVKVSLFVKGFMDFPSESEVIQVLKPKSRKVIELSASFNNKVLNITEDTPQQALIKVEYFAEGKQLQLSQTKNFKLYNRNAMTWDIIDKLASFTTPKDPPVKNFARTLIQRFSDIELSGMNEKLAAGALLFDALGKYGMTYVLDPQSPLRQRGSTSEVVDYIQFPRDSMRFKTGDCDDLTVLFASLLQNIGINTALLDLKDHILMMFNTEVPESDKNLITANSKLIVIRDGTVWIPVETTMYGKSFFDAWKFGAQEYYNSENSGKLTVVPILDAWDNFPPVTLEQTTWEPKLPSKNVIWPAFRQDINSINSVGVDSTIRELKGKLSSSPNDTESMNKLALLYVDKEDFSSAIQTLKKAIRIQPNTAKYYNNLGNIYLIQENNSVAEKMYKKAIALSPNKAGYYFNLANLYEKTGQTKLAEQMLEKADKLLK